ncbi:VOC family protein [Methylocella sp. CPCC 101449]|jgi:catechol-2,3-dioxygenase|uniref:VOC family protein n=1 Tax=Methylocella sp. CPCC 101449 TaxID=2987531 RepID=UPI00288F818E|nr:VOC family protein [Methylocella sp. CPCC 101449]MDT2022315.1 VOC family protein [Methylocella sp. CPCC 101449]HEV2572958.1 VOC family protein [Beijerinckiaceae bacterium]
MINVRRLGHATLTTPNLNRAIEYYNEVIGLNVVARDRKSAILATKVGLEAIALVEGDQAELARLSFQVAPGTDLNDCIKALAKHGVKAERRSEISPGVKEAITFKDNKGTAIDVYAEYEFAKDMEKPIGIMPLKLGHVAYRCEDIKPVMQFYMDVLGFRLSDIRGDFFCFLRCNSDHHAVNFVNDPKAQLHHIAFEVKDWPEIHRACDYLAKNNLLLVWGPGRHIIGHNIAAYHRNHDGVRVELYTEMDQMKDEALGYFDPRPWHQETPLRPKQHGPETLRNYWGFGSGSTANMPGYP